MQPLETPEWVRDAVFYQIFPDRFATSQAVPKPSNLETWQSPPTAHGFKGGDLLGVADHLDYLQDLGVTAIYFNPIFQSTANHRYHTFDYYRVDPILGGNDGFQTLLDDAHRRGLRVILDGVFNHASRGFFQFNHIVENGAASPYVDWFVINGYPLQPYNTHDGEHGYDAWWNLPALPKLNVQTLAVREFLWDVACHWVELGIDGWRLDVPGEIDDEDFWREFRRRVKAINPDAYLVGEVWHDAQRWLRGDQFDAVMNYVFTRACLAFFVGEDLLHSEVARTGYHSIDPLGPAEFAEEIDRLLGLYSRPVTEAQFNLLGSHDTPRFRTLARGDDSAYELATLFQMTFPGAPCVYYGDEIGMEGKHDPGCRGGFPWDEGAWNHRLREHVRRSIALRRDHPALRRGDFTWLTASDGTVVYLRSLPEETIVVALNQSRKAAAPDIEVAGYLQDGTWLRDLWHSGTVGVSQGRIRGLQVGPRSWRVLEVMGRAEV